MLRLRFLLRLRRRRRVAVVPIDWERLTNWLSDMEDCLPEGVYLQVCELAKRLYFAQTSHEQHDLIQELRCHNEEQWGFVTRNSLCC